MNSTNTLLNRPRRTLKSRIQCLPAFLVTALLCIVVTTDSFAKDASFSWDANQGVVSGYKLYYKKGGEGVAPIAPFTGFGALEGPSPIDVGNQTSFTIHGLDESATYHFAVTAYNTSGESDFSSTITMAPIPTIKGIISN